MRLRAEFPRQQGQLFIQGEKSLAHTLDKRHTPVLTPPLARLAFPACVFSCPCLPTSPHTADTPRPLLFLPNPLPHSPSLYPRASSLSVQPAVDLFRPRSPERSPSDAALASALPLSSPPHSLPSISLAIHPVSSCLLSLLCLYLTPFPKILTTP